jgi:2',3'-cyclic-nucleotide 2'-phosphodiesterase (5'-nucleotidase family)
MKISISTIILLTVCSFAFSQARDTICFVQINDIYEIIDSCKKRYQTYSLLAGDFLSPSVMGTALVDGEKLSGRQMVDGLNALGINYVTFGNHEFDIGETALRKRFNESKFTWFSTNVFQKDGTPFYKDDNGNKKPFPTSIAIESRNKQFNVRLFSLTLPSNTPPYSKFLSYDSALQTIRPLLTQQNTLNIGLTHLPVAEDVALLEKYPSFRLLMGGHDHENMFLTSSHNTYVAKADANGETVYMHLLYKDAAGRLTTSSKLIQINESIPANPAVAALVSSWEEKVYQSFRKQGIEPTRSVCVLTDTLNGTEASIRFEQNKMGVVVNNALSHGAGVDASFFNSGTVRIDDYVTGYLTELDVIRIMPLPNSIVEVELKGALLEELVKTNESRKGLGGYLQFSAAIALQGERVLINGKPLVFDQTYKIRTLEFLLTGKELKLGYFTPKNPLITSVTNIMENEEKPLDLRIAFINYLRVNTAKLKQL